jgi:class 3 adenylate cyclase
MSAENVAFLFTDLVGSTAVFQGLDPEAADDVRRQHFASLRRALAEHGGTEVKNLGDGLMAVFTSPSSALACAVAMQQFVEEDGRTSPAALGLRVGLSTGEVVHEDGDYFGDPVIEAARLCARCEGGQILSAEIVRLVAGRRTPAPVREVGALELKGLADPVPTIEVLWEPIEPTAGQWTGPLPPRLAHTTRQAAGVVGREAELSQLSDSLKRVAAESGREVVLVSGEAGQGKTTLVGEAARAAHEDGACVLFGHCEEELATPYQMFAEAMGHFFAHADEDRVRGILAEHGGEWARFVPEMRARIPDLAPSKATDRDSERFLLFAAATGILRAISRDDTVVLVLDDLQWADSGSLALFRHLASSEQAMRVLVLGTFRDKELSQAPMLRETLGSLWRNDGVTRVELEGLTNAGVQALMEVAAGQPLDNAQVDLAQAIHRETDGNPFFATEVLRHLRDTGAIHRDDAGRWIVDDADPTLLPTSVREVIDARLVRLGEEAQRVLSVAAVIGRDFDLELLARAVDLAPDVVIGLLEAAHTASLVREVRDAPGRYVFSHALVQRTIYDGLGAARRGTLHELIARALEELCGGKPGRRVGELARHWQNATRPGNLDPAIHYTRGAGDAALRSLAPAEALRHYTKALELCAERERNEPLVLLDLMIGLGTAQRQTGDPSFRRTLLDAAIEASRLGEIDQLVKACLANDRGFYSAVGATDHEKVEVLRLALAQLPADHPDRALILATMCSEVSHGTTLTERQALSDEAIRVAELSGDDEVIVRVLNHVHVPLQVPSLLAFTDRLTVEARERADRIGDPVLQFWAAQWRVESAARGGNIDEADRSLAAHEALAEKLHQPVFTWAHLFVRSLRAQIAGDVELAERYATEALEVGTAGGQPDAARIFGGQFNIISGQRGTQSELIPMIERLASETPDIPRNFWVSVLAKAHVEGDRPDVAVGFLEEFAAAGFELPLDQLWLTGMVDIAEAAIECGDPAYAGPMFDLLEPWAPQIPITGGSALPPVRHYLGGLATVLGRLDEADRFFSDAAALSRRIGAKFFAARTDLLWGRMLLARSAPDDAAKARDLLQRAHRVSAEQSYAVVERRAAALLETLG